MPDDQLPVELPYLTGTDLAPKGTSPLAAATDWVNVACPTCGGPATRDTDTMDTFVDSSWYFFRYCSPGYQATARSTRRTSGAGCRSAQYVGGVEHAILHLLYMRFFTKVLHDMGMLDFAEPMRRLLNQGQVINQGKSMSKSLGNGVDLGEQIDNVRRRRRPADGGLRRPAGGRHRLGRPVAGRFAEVPAAGVPAGGGRHQRARRRSGRRRRGPARDHPPAAGRHRRSASRPQRFNVAVARIMELVNATRKVIDSGAGPADPAVREAAEIVAIALSLVSPYVAEEMWEKLGHQPSVANASWPEVGPSRCW